jgi:DNA-directed RNA polymerase subunit K/omega
MRQMNDLRKPLDLSRGTTIDMEKCVEQAGGNRFNLVLIASERARVIRRQNKESVDRKHVYSIVTALDDIQLGTVDPTAYLAKVK